MIDWNRVDELISEVGSEDFGEVVEIFLEEVETAISELAVSTETDRNAELLHLVKGCAWNLGFAALGKECAAYEQSNSPLTEDAGQLLLRCFEGSRESFLSGLSERSLGDAAA